MEVTKWLKPSDSSPFNDTTRVDGRMAAYSSRR